MVGHAEVERLFPMERAIEVMASVLALRTRGGTFAPLRQVTWLPDGRGAVAWMPADIPGQEALGGKILTVYPQNSRTPYESHQGVVLLFDRMYGRLLAVLDASAVTAVRTAAVSAVATKVLAREDASTVTVVGTGTQARLHAIAMCAVRPVREIRVWGRSPERARRLSAELVASPAFAPASGIQEARTVSAWVDLREAVRDADIVCTATSSRSPIVKGAWLAPGTHVNAVGAAVPGFREWDCEAVGRARVYMDARESALAEADEIRTALAEGWIGLGDLVGELGEVLTGRVPARQNAEEVTFFKSLGLAVEDLATAESIYRGLLEEPESSVPLVEFAATRNGGSDR